MQIFSKISTPQIIIFSFCGWFVHDLKDTLTIQVLYSQISYIITDECIVLAILMPIVAKENNVNNYTNYYLFSLSNSCMSN
jgi:hypothetical protein